MLDALGLWLLISAAAVVVYVLWRCVAKTDRVIAATATDDAWEKGVRSLTEYRERRVQQTHAMRNRS